MTDSKPPLRSIAVFCGSSPGRSPEHMALASELGRAIAARGLRLVYGGGGLGVMGAVSDAAHSHGADVLGVIPDFLREAERAQSNIEHIYVPDMHQRKIRMYQESDAFIVLPGGIGTLEETIEVLSWQQLNLHTKPILFLSGTGFWDGLLKELTRLIDEQFARPSLQDDLLRASHVDEAFEKIQHRIDNPVDRPPIFNRDLSIETLI